MTQCRKIYARTWRPKSLERDFLQFMPFEADDSSKVLTEIFLSNVCYPRNQPQKHTEKASGSNRNISTFCDLFWPYRVWRKKVKQSICHLPSLSVNNTVLHLKVIKRYWNTLNIPDLILSILQTELLFLQHKLNQLFYRPTRTFFLDQPYPKLKYTCWKPAHSLQNNINPYIVFSQIPGNEVGIFSNNHPATRSVIVF